MKKHKKKTKKKINSKPSKGIYTSGLLKVFLLKLCPTASLDKGCGLFWESKGFTYTVYTLPEVLQNLKELPPNSGGWGNEFDNYWLFLEQYGRSFKMYERGLQKIVRG